MLPACLMAGLESWGCGAACVFKNTLLSNDNGRLLPLSQVLLA